MTPWFRPDRPERLQALAAQVNRWIGTPFFPNSSTPGPRGGVSCQKLVGSVYREVGYVDVEIPDVPMSHARFALTSLVEEFLARHPQMVRIEPREVGQEQPGDLLGFRLHRTIHHLGLCVAPGLFVHAIEPIGVTRCALADPTWGRRLAAIWRPTEP